jgi:ATP-dependent DNA helicase PIF1
VAELIKKAEIFIWDEAPTANKYTIETVDRSFRDVMKTVRPELENVPFGGKTSVRLFIRH